MIKEYHFGSMTVGDRPYKSDIKIIDGKVVVNWWRKEAHSLDVEDVEDVLASSAEMLVVGMGQPGNMLVSESLRLVLSEKGMGLIDQPTEQAVKTFNHLSGCGKRVAGAFHLTC